MISQGACARGPATARRRRLSVRFTWHVGGPITHQGATATASAREDVLLAAVVMGAVGSLVGLGLDRLAVLLAWPPGASEEPDETGREDAGDETPRPLVALGSERGEVAVHPRYSWRTLAVVIVTAATFAAVGARFDALTGRVVVPAAASVFILCATTDAMSFRVPNAVTYPAALAALLLGMALPDGSRADILAGGLLSGGLLFVPALLTASMGMGDAKLALFAGLVLGLRSIVPALLIMAVAGGIVAGALLALRLRPRGAPMPYAPFIALGAIAALLMQGPAVAPLT